ncbi:hypothetical protein ACIBCS_36490 [Streptomyces phaeochromogenes]|uniref:hypothetical protein n=1 Tax=Streptomyces phaeochromogenes TaxID=1923 RepID=UPI00340E2F55
MDITQCADSGEVAHDRILSGHYWEFFPGELHVMGHETNLRNSWLLRFEDSGALVTQCVDTHRSALGSDAEFSRPSHYPDFCSRGINASLNICPACLEPNNCWTIGGELSVG